MILLIRHGETRANAERVLQMPDSPLSERGIGQAKRLAKRISKVGVSRILVSDFRRAEMTAEPIARACGLHLELEPLLQERNFGALRGRAYADLDCDPFAPGYAPPEGESWEQFYARVDQAWARILARAAQTLGNLAVVTHGLVCRALVERHLGLETEIGAFLNTCVTEIEAAPPGRVTRLACTAHLATGPEAGPKLSPEERSPRGSRDGIA